MPQTLLAYVNACSLMRLRRHYSNPEVKEAIEELLRHLR
jgi:hypothetical protein